MVHPRGSTPLHLRHRRFAKIPRIATRATVNNLHNDTVTYPTRIGAVHAARVGHLVAGAAVAGRAVGRGIGVDGDLAVALAGVDGAIARAAGDVGREVAGGGAISTWCAWEMGCQVGGDRRGRGEGRGGTGPRAADGVALAAEVDKGGYAGERRCLAPVQDISSAGCEGGDEVEGGEEEE